MRSDKKAPGLALLYNLGFDRIKTQHFFNGENAPQTLRGNNLYDNFINMIEAKYLVNKFLRGYDITFVFNNPDLIENFGKVLKTPVVDT